MGEIIQFKKPKAKDKHKGKTLCRNGFHKWEPLKDKPFDVKQGKLVTVLRCIRCGITRTETR
ncbi:MAG: hypothetical protein OEZ39_17390 [Gammaproteobacteria bacterium]|nr:hypothetical protein [Gammaproteobacteria bacterium]MDH5653638.1 hypothetical protein [Gammaproteobacteria bacterium]